MLNWKKKIIPFEIRLQPCKYCAYKESAFNHAEIIWQISKTLSFVWINKEVINHD